MSNSSLRDKIRSVLTGLTSQIRKHPFVSLCIAVIAALTVGKVLGSWATCGQQCGFDTNFAAALGSWVGGLATAAAFAFTAHQLILSRQREERSNRLRAETVLIQARNIHFIFYPGPKMVYSDRKLVGLEPEVTLRVVNEAESAVTDVRVLRDSSKKEPNEKELARTAQINGVDSKGKSSLWQVGLNPADLGLEPDPDTKMVPNADQAKISVEFKMEGHRFRWTKGEVNLIDEP